MKYYPNYRSRVAFYKAQFSFFNGFPEILTNCEVTQFADNTITFVSVKDVDCIECNLNEETFVENELVINSKAGKTESVPLNTSKKLFTVSNQLNLSYDQTEIHTEESYKYLGAIINPSLNLELQFHKVHKQMSSNLKLLRK